MNAYVAVTDFDWFRYLASMPDVDEVNFWTPNPWGGRFGVLDRGQPLLFKLRASEGGWIVGGGFFEHYTDLPISLAWDAFGEKNGAPSIGAVRERIARLRRDDTNPWAEYTIGCIVLVEPFFFPRDDWIPPPPDWAPNIVRGRRYDLTVSPGREFWGQVIARLRASDLFRESGEFRLPPEQPKGGFSDPKLQRRRLGQGTFRVVITDLYKRQCAVTGERALPALEAAHIRPFSERPVHEIRNGLLLRSDVHRLLDSGYLTVTPEHRVEVSTRMRDDFNDGKNYLRLHGGTVLVPEREEHQPDPEILRWHNENRYRG